MIALDLSQSTGFERICDGDYSMSSSGTVQCDVLIDGDIEVSADITFSGSVEVRSGTIKVMDGYTVNFTGDFSGPTREIFTGSGTIAGIRMVKPEWWGAGYGVNSADAIMKAYACASSTLSTRRGAVFMNGYTIEKMVNIKLSTTTSIDFIGGGVNLVAGRQKLTADFADDVAFRFYCDSSSAVASFGVADIAIENVTGSAAVRAMQFCGMSGLTQNVVSRVTTHGFGYGFDILNTRLITLDYCATWSGTASVANGVVFRTDGIVSGQFVGDCKINACQFETAGAGASISCLITTATHQCKGIHVSKTALYKSTGGNQLYVYAAAGAQVGDWMFDAACQFDGFSSKYMSLIADGSGTLIDDFVFTGTYFRGSTDDGAITIRGQNGGKVGAVRFGDIFLANSNGNVINIESASGVIFNGMNLYDITGNADVITVNNSKSVLVNGVVATRSGSGYFARLVNAKGSSDYVTVSNCITSGIPSTAIFADNSTGTHNKSSNNS